VIYSVRVSRHTAAPADDHVGRLIAQRRRETPEVPLDGMEVLGRARRLTLLSRPAIEAVFARHGLDTGEFDVLATLSRSGRPYALRPTELYQSLMISSGGLTARLNRLEQRGYVSREASPSDGRSLLVHLTAKGRVVIETAFAEDMAVEARMLAPLGRRERRVLAGLLAKLLSGMEARGGE
jgi:DNA-binding MarR family transcriptional regulator